MSAAESLNRNIYPMMEPCRQGRALISQDMVETVAYLVIAFLANLFENLKASIYQQRFLFPSLAPAIPEGKDWVLMEKGEGNPILFVHGRNGRYSDNFLVAKNLKKLGCQRPLYAIRIENSGELTIEECAEKINRVAERILRPGQRISLIGHSYGGLKIAEAALQNSSVDQITTVSSPMLGTKVANLPFLSQVTQENLGYRAPKLRDLNGRLQQANFKIHHIVSSHWDHLVFPPHVMSTDANCQKIVYQGPLGHVGIINDEWTAQKLMEIH